MYDTQEHYHEHKHYITEKRAPTDESVRLLNEFQEKARLNIVNSIKATDNNLNITGIWFINSPASRDIDFYGRFTLNEKDYSVKSSVEKMKWKKTIIDSYSKLGHIDIFNNVHKILADAIAWELMKGSPDFIEYIKNNDLLEKY